MAGWGSELIDLDGLPRGLKSDVVSGDTLLTNEILLMVEADETPPPVKADDAFQIGDAGIDSLLIGTGADAGEGAAKAALGAGGKGAANCARSLLTPPLRPPVAVANATGVGQVWENVSAAPSSSLTTEREHSDTCIAGLGMVREVGNEDM